VRQRHPPPHWRARLRAWALKETVRQCSLKKPPEGMGSHKYGGRWWSVQRKNADGVHVFDACLQRIEQCSVGRRPERRPVGDDNRRPSGKDGDECMCRTRLRFDKRVVTDPLTIKSASVVSHSIQNEGVSTVARPLSVACEGLDDEERKFQLQAPADRVIEGEVPVGTPRDRHPVQDEVAVSAWREVLDQPDAFGERRQSD
jgi:hypothetical protein